MNWGSRRQRVVSAYQYVRLSSAERAWLRALADNDSLKVTDYLTERIGGHLYAENGYSVVHDLTTTRDTNFDSISELKEAPSA